MTEPGPHWFLICSCGWVEEPPPDTLPGTQLPLTWRYTERTGRYGRARQSPEGGPLEQPPLRGR